MKIGTIEIFSSADGSVISTVTGNSGGAVGPDETTNNLNVLGSGAVLVSGNPATNTLTISESGAGVPWFEVTSDTQMDVDTGYVVGKTSGGPCKMTLPVNAGVGSIIFLLGSGAAGWTIAQNAGQICYLGMNGTTVGAAGSLSSTNQHNCVTIVCTQANTEFTLFGVQGNITVV